MSRASVDLANPLVRNMGPLSDRKSPSTLDMKLPPDTRLVSADNHWELSEDIFYEHFP